MHQTFRQFYIRMVALVAALLFLLPGIPVARAASGSCGDGVTWEAVGSVLTVSGNGAMENYSETAPAPWSGLGITAVIIEKGVTSVGEFAFFRLESLTALTLSDSVTSVGMYALYGCKNLTLLELGQGLQRIGQSAFEQCVSLMSLRLPNSLTSLGHQAFYCCESLQNVTVPDSVTWMDTAVFAHCTGLRTAIVNAQMDTLPVWTFYGCTSLEQVILNPVITETGVDAFKGSAMINPPVRGTLPFEGNFIHSSTTQDQAGNTITQDYAQSANSTINTQTNSSGNVTVDAVLENSNGWIELEEQIQNNGTNGQTEINLQLKDTVVSGADLGQFSGQDVVLQIQTPQGAIWSVNGTNLPVRGLAESYDLTFTISPLTERNKKQKEFFGDSTAYLVIFASDLDFKTEVVLPLGTDQARRNAAFYELRDGEYVSLQNVLIDDAGKAHFYLQQVTGGVEYIVGIDVTGQQQAAPLIPEPLKHEYGVDQENEIEYVVTGVKSSWGMDIKQVTWILIGVMGGSILVVGIVIAVMNKMRLKKGYMPELTEEEIAEIRASARKKK